MVVSSASQTSSAGDSLQRQSASAGRCSIGLQRSRSVGAPCRRPLLTSPSVGSESPDHSHGYSESLPRFVSASLSNWKGEPQESVEGVKLPSQGRVKHQD